MWVGSLGGEDPLEGGHSNPLQYSCLENPVDRGAWWATVYRVTKSQTQLKQQGTPQRTRALEGRFLTRDHRGVPRLVLFYKLHPTPRSQP